MGFKIELNLGFLKLSYDLPKTEQAMFTTLLRDFASHRVLYEPYQSEYAGKVVSSVIGLRSKIEAVIKGLGQSSKLADGLMALSYICAKFLTETKNISEKLIYDTELTRENLNSGAIKKGGGIHDDLINNLEHYDRIGGPDLMSNKRINVMDIVPPDYQHRFLTNLGEFRGAFGLFIMTLAGQTGCIIPDQLKPIITFEETIKAANSK